jgi:site-specific DNA-methyltransferase (adenine-specific)
MPQSKGCQWDVKIDLVEFWKQVKRLAKDDHTPVLMFCNTKFGYDLIKSNEKWFRYDLVVDKAKTRGVSFLSANRMPLKSHEMVYVFSKKGAYYKRIDLPPDERCPVSVIKINNFASKDKHPTEKPEELYEWLLSRYCPAGGTVLDPTAGSFNSISVARNLGFKAIGIEKNTSFFSI